MYKIPEISNTQRDNLDAMFRPRTIAIVGASADQSNLNGRVLRFLKDGGYTGTIYPVNPKYIDTGIAGIQCYSSVRDVPERVDLAIIARGKQHVIEALEDCIQAKVRAITIFSAGSMDLDPIAARIGEHKIAVNGPNCAGLINVREKVFATFNSAMDRGQMLPGPISFVAQSGALATYILAKGMEQGLGFDYWVSTGNEWSLGFATFVSYFVDQPTTRTIIGYMEDVRNSSDFEEAALKALDARKPLVILKAGTTETGAAAATAHTNALAGADAVYDATFKKYGVIRAKTVDELLDFAIIAASPKCPSGPRTALMTISGGGGILMCDSCAEASLTVANLAEPTETRLRELLPEFASLHPVVDFSAELVAKPSMLRAPLEVVLSDPGVDNLAIFLGAQDHNASELATSIIEAAAKTKKFIVVNWMAAPPVAKELLKQNGIPLFDDPHRGIRALGAMANYVKRRKHYLDTKGAPDSTYALRNKWKHGGDTASERQTAARQMLATARTQLRRNLSEDENKCLLHLYGISTPLRQLVTNKSQAVEAAQHIGFPVVMKIASPDILHKTEVGGVRLNVASPEQVTTTYAELIANGTAKNPSAQIDGVLVEQSIPNGIEVIVGMKRDPSFGPVVTVGWGGIHVQVIRDSSLRLLPIDQADALAMLAETKIFKLLSEDRERKVYDLAALCKVLVATGEIAKELADELTFLEINPLKVLPEGQGVFALDALTQFNGSKRFAKNKLCS